MKKRSPPIRSSLVQEEHKNIQLRTTALVASVLWQRAALKAAKTRNWRAISETWGSASVSPSRSHRSNPAIHVEPPGPRANIIERPGLGCRRCPRSLVPYYWRGGLELGGARRPAAAGAHAAARLAGRRDMSEPQRDRSAS